MKHPWLAAGVVAALILSGILFQRAVAPERDVSTVELALLGHWRAENGDDIFYGPDMAIAVTPEGTRSYHPYRLLMINEGQSWLKILIGNNEGKDVERVIHFNRERDVYQTATAVLSSGGRVLRQATVTYVDGRQTP